MNHRKVLLLIISLCLILAVEVREIVRIELYLASPTASLTAGTYAIQKQAAQVQEEMDAVLDKKK